MPCQAFTPSLTFYVIPLLCRVNALSGIHDLPAYLSTSLLEPLHRLYSIFALSTNVLYSHHRIMSAYKVEKKSRKDYANRRKHILGYWTDGKDDPFLMWLLTEHEGLSYSALKAVLRFAKGVQNLNIARQAVNLAKLDRRSQRTPGSLIDPKFTTGDFGHAIDLANEGNIDLHRVNQLAELQEFGFTPLGWVVSQANVLDGITLQPRNPVKSLNQPASGNDDDEPPRDPGKRVKRKRNGGTDPNTPSCKNEPHKARPKEGIMALSKKQKTGDTKKVAYTPAVTGQHMAPAADGGQGSSTNPLLVQHDDSTSTSPTPQPGQGIHSTNTQQTSAHMPTPQKTPNKLQKTLNKPLPEDEDDMEVDYEYATATLGGIYCNECSRSQNTWLLRTVDSGRMPPWDIWPSEEFWQFDWIMQIFDDACGSNQISELDALKYTQAYYCDTHLRRIVTNLGICTEGLETEVVADRFTRYVRFLCKNEQEFQDRGECVLNAYRLGYAPKDFALGVNTTSAGASFVKLSALNNDSDDSGTEENV